MVSQDIEHRYKQSARRRIAEAADELVGLSHRIHAHPEPAFQEHRAARWVTDTLASHGFVVRTGTADLPTSVTASSGQGELVIAFCAEYDALPEIGHACGHNIIAAAAVGAGIALASLAAELDVTVKVLGTPAEERGGGKILMLDGGAFVGVHAALEVHPGPFDTDYVTCQPLACAELRITYDGQDHRATAHTVERAVTTIPVDSGTGERVTYTVVGHDSDQTTVRCSLRATTLDRLRGMENQVRDLVGAAADTGGTSVSVGHDEPPYSHFIGDPDLETCYANNLRELGRTPAAHPDNVYYSTDLGNVSLAIPTIHPTIGIDSGMSINHDPAFTAYCASPSADAAMLRGATAMSWTAIDAAVHLRAKLLHRPGS